VNGIRSVVVESGASGYVQTVAIGPHRLTADEPIAAGGADEGPNPPELLLAALGVCKGMTVRMYAERKRWPLRAVRVNLGRSQAEGAEQIDVTISFVGDLSEEQRLRLLEIAEHCPVHRMLISGVKIRSSLERRCGSTTEPPFTTDAAGRR
jgi:putative redox protein